MRVHVDRLRAWTRHALVVLVVPMAIGSSVVGTAAAQEVPDVLPALAEPVTRGGLEVTRVADRAPTTKVVDGKVDDWVGTSARLAGNSHYDRGEFLHTDFVWDAYGADAGEDVQRWNDFAGLFYAQRRAIRLDAVARTLEGQLGVPYPIGADEEYGNANRDLALADINDLRFAADADTVHVLLRTGAMTSTDDLGILLLADTGDGGSPADARLGLPEDHRFDVVLPIGLNALGVPDGVEVAADPTGWTNAVEIGVPTALVAPSGTLDLSVIAGQVAEDGTFVPLNIAFRHAEPVDIYNDRKQAFALHGDAPDGSHLDEFSSGPIALDDLRAGRTEFVRPGPGYHERHFDSIDKISTEGGQNGRTQPYGLFVPSDLDLSTATPTTFWLHYRGGRTHSGATINPRLIHELAREDPSGIGLSAGQGNYVITPNARGTSFWYVARSHQDFWEVYDDAHRLLPNIDPQRRYLAGYSMGGYGTYLLATLYPDLFAAGYPTSGAVTQGAWTGLKDNELCGIEEPASGDNASPCFIEANDGNASAQLTHRVLDNVRHVPLHIDHGTNDELVPVTGVQAMAARLIELGYRVEMQTFPGYEHFSQAAVDEWADGAAYLQRFTAPVDPRQVTYRVVPALVHALNTIRWDGEPFDFDPDGAYWVDDIEVREPDVSDPTVSGLVDVTSGAIDEPGHLTIPVAGTASPGHSTPFVRHGLDWIEDPLGGPTVGNTFEADLANVASVTLDADRMGLAHDLLVGTMTTDGPSTVTLAGWGPGGGAVECLDCDLGLVIELFWTTDDVDIPLPEAGTWTFTAAESAGAVAPAPAPGPAPAPPDEPAPAGPLPATGGGAAALGLAALAVAGVSRRRGHGRRGGSAATVPAGRTPAG